ncbi:MAG: hypothetical protein HY653_04175 [Acidobacteria bacterium]|nr:hypothetical protein [Acidobacteriota bacterium]
MLLPELTDDHVRILERLRATGFELVAFPLFPAHIGVRQDNCVALLEPRAAGEFGIVGQPSYLVDGNLSVKVDRGDGIYFVWKSERVEATPARLARLREFEAALRQSLVGAP